MTAAGERKGQGLPAEIVLSAAAGKGISPAFPLAKTKGIMRDASGISIPPIIGPGMKAWPGIIKLGPAFASTWLSRDEDETGICIAPWPLGIMGGKAGASAPWFGCCSMFCL